MRTTPEPLVARDATLPVRSAAAWLGRACVLAALAWTLVLGSLGSAVASGPLDVLVQRAQLVGERRLDTNGRSEPRRASRRGASRPAQVEAAQGGSPLATHEGELAADRACATESRGKSVWSPPGPVVLPEAARWRADGLLQAIRLRSVEVLVAFHAGSRLRESVPDPRGPPLRA